MTEPSAASSRKESTFYEHSTRLLSEMEPILDITSLRKPEVRLRLPNQNDAKVLLRLFSDPRNVQYDKTCDGLNTLSAIRDLIEQWSRPPNPLKRANVVVTVHGQVVGTGGLGWIGERKSDGRVIGDAGLMLESGSRGRGYAYEALSMVIDHGFMVLGMDEVHISCVDANVAFKGLMNRKYGFEAEPTSDRFGNEWVWKIMKADWCKNHHHSQKRECGAK